MTAPRAIVLLNPHGGSAGDEPEAKVAAALRGAGVAHDIILANGSVIGDRAAQAVKDGAPMVIAAGGDGTVSAVAGAVAGRDAMLGILPLGTLNHFARDLGIATDLDEAARIIARGKVQAVDAATMNGRLFVNNSAIGLYPLMVADREAQQHRLGRSKRAAMVVAGLRTLARFRHHRLTLTVNDAAKATIDTPLLFVGNNDYRIALPRAGARDALDDARLSVVLLRRHGRLAFVAALLRGLVGRSRADDLVHLDDVTSLRVASRRSRLMVAVDGETSEQPPTIDYCIRPAALKVIVP